MLSIVIPTRDTRDLTLACLRAVARAAPPGRLDVIVVDDGSVDDTAQRLQGDYPDARLVRLDTPRGFTAAVNAGLRVAEGSLLLLLNSDTEVQPGAIAALMDAFDAEPRLGIVGAQLWNADGSPQWSGARREPGALWLFAHASGLARLAARLPGYRRVKPLASSTRRVAWVSGAALAMRREVWTTCGPFDERFRFYAQDLDLCSAATAAGWSIAVVDAFNVLHHQGVSVAAASGGAIRQNTALLWADVVRWASKRRGGTASRRAALALALGGRGRLFCRSLVSPLVPRAQRAHWERETQALGSALRAVRSAAS